MSITTQEIPKSDSIRHDSSVKGDMTGVKKNIRFKPDSIKNVDAKADSTLKINLTDTISNSSSEIFLPQEQTIDLYHGNELKAKHNLPERVNDFNPDWMFPVIIIVVGMFTWLRIYYNKFFLRFFSAIFNSNITNQIVRDENVLVQRASVVLSVAFYLVMAMFLYILSIHYNWLSSMSTGIVRFVFLALIVAAAYAFKFIVLKITGYIFDLGKETSSYIFTVFLINNIQGIVLFPLIVLLLFGHAGAGNIIIIPAIVIAVSAYLYRLARGVQIGISVPGFSPVYLFLYLCALEIAPLIVIVKLVMMQR
jgi:hypothetical protein